VLEGLCSTANRLAKHKPQRTYLRRRSSLLRS